MPTALCGPSAPATYYANPLWTSSIGDQPICAPLSPYTTKLYTSQSPGAFSTLCDQACDSAPGSSCKAYVATATSVLANSDYQVRCFLYTTQVPDPVPCTAGPAHAGVVARYRDGVSGCFARSVTQAVRYCSSLLGKAGPGTKVDFTATTRPTSTTTVTAVVTKSVCLGAGGRARAIFGDEDILPEPTEEPAAPTNPAWFPEPTPAPDRRLLAPRAEIAPACLAETAAFPSWDVSAACSCLASVSELTTKAVSTAPVTTKTVTSTTTTRVNKGPVATFQPQIVVPGAAKSGGGQFKIISRMVKDSPKNGAGEKQDRRVLMYTKQTKGVGGGDGISGSDGNVDVHIGKNNNLYVVSRERNVLKPYGMLPLVALGGSGGSAVTVIGSLVSSADDKNNNNLRHRRATTEDEGGAGVAAAASNGEAFASCFAVPVPGGDITCKLPGGAAAVFSEVLVPGEKKRYAIAVGTTAVKGAKVVKLIATGWGSVIVGCGGGGKD